MRQRFGLDKTFNIGFSTFKGSVTAAKNWDEAAQCDRVRNGLYDSWEHIFQAGAKSVKQDDYYLIFRSNNPEYRVDPEIVSTFSTQRLERYIGVIYRPDSEKASHYCQSQIAKEYDAVIFINETSAVQPLDKTVPWENEHANMTSLRDIDDFPELEPGIHLSDDMLDWRLKASEKINEAGRMFLERKDYHTALAKFDKAVKYLEHNLQRFQTNRNLQHLRAQVLINRAEASTNLKIWNSVIRDCSVVLTLKPNLPQAHLLIARAYEVKGNRSESQFHFDMAAKTTAQQPIKVPQPTQATVEGRR